MAPDAAVAVEAVDRDTNALVATLRDEIARARADLAAAAPPGTDLTSAWCLARSRDIDALIARYMRLVGEFACGPTAPARRDA